MFLAGLINNMEYIKDYEQLLMPFIKCRPHEIHFMFGQEDNPNTWRDRTRWVGVKKPSEWNWERYEGEEHHRLMMHYGKYKGMTYEEIVQEDIGYARWLVTKAERMSENDRRYMGWLIWMYQ